MRTIVYEKPLPNQRKKYKWFWANADRHTDEHGPFDTKAEAADAARAASITAAAEQRKASNVLMSG